jgi:NAD+ synthase
MDINVDICTHILTNFILEETKKVGFHNVVVGLSGGVDSALTTKLATIALGCDHVFAYILPYKFSNKENVNDAVNYAKHLGINYEILDITPMADPYILNNNLSNLRIGNILARLRMVVLFDKSAQHNGLVLGTSNKTELLLGYGTWYGDMASSINPIGDLYKTQVWQIGEYLKIPLNILEKAPSADLWEGQTDEKDLGFKYNEIDSLLYYLVDQRMGIDKLTKLGFKVEMIGRIKEMIRKSQFKRQLPVIAKISFRTIDKDFRYCRDWGY